MNDAQRGDLFFSPYNTLVTRGVYGKMEKIAEELYKGSVVHGDDADTFELEKDRRNKLRIVKLKAGFLHGIEFFQHPIVHKGLVFIDCRNYFDRHGRNIRLSDYQLLVKRAKILAAWIEDPLCFSGQQSFIVDSFSTWLTYGLQKTYGVDLMTAQYIRIITAAYMFGILHRTKKLTNQEINDLILFKLPRIINVPLNTIQEFNNEYTEVLNNFVAHGDLTHDNNMFVYLCAVLSRVCFNDDVDLENLSQPVHGLSISPAAVRNSVCNGAFVGTDGVTVASVALEHLATYVFILDICTQKGIQQGTKLGSAIVAISRKHEVEPFKKHLDSILSDSYDGT
jgi:hypothetical protein